MTFKCKENCGICCKAVAVNSDFVKKHPPSCAYRRVNNTYLHENADICAWLGADRKCSIYDKRPEACVSFGCGSAARKHDSMKCPFFNPDGSERTPEDRDRILKLCNTEEEMKKLEGRPYAR